MRNRHLHAQLRRATATVGVAAAAAMASALTLAPAAMADDSTDVTSEPSDPPAAEDPPPADPPSTPDTPADPGDEEPTEPPADDPAEEPSDPTATDEAQKKPAPKGERASTEAAIAAVEPDFGYNKFRVGVQIEDGRYVPDGVTTLGSQITITETGPGVPDGEVSATCTTTLPDPVEPTTTFCEDFSDFPALNDFVVPTFGDTVTITQTTVNDGLRIVDGTKIDVPNCDPEQNPDFPGCFFNAGDILLTDAPLPPEASDDETCVDPGEPVSIDVLDNDDRRGAPLTNLEVTLDPEQGSASVTGSGNDRRIRFSPSAGFSGSDSFDYRLSTANGSADATVDVTTCAEEGVLPDTGGGDPRILGTGLALIVGGGALAIGGGRRRRELSVVD